jgi:long-chain fatty acid transport protein
MRTLRTPPRACAPLLVSALLGGALVLAARNGAAAGFHINEQDARATGRAGAVLANPRNASAIHYNPAGIAPLRGLQLNLGASLVTPSAEFEPAGGGTETTADADTFVLPHLYASARLTEVVALGIGVNAPFGLALSWPSTSPGRSQSREGELRTTFVSPVIGLELSRWAPGLAVGAGIDLVPASVRTIRDVLFGTQVGSAALSGTAFGVGARVGLLYRPENRPDWAFGLTYKSPVALHFEGDADFDAPAIYRPSLPPDGNGATDITLPQSLMLGLLFQPLPSWEIEVDGGWVGWSSYDRLDIQLPDGSVSRSEKAWKDTLVLRVGTEYTFAERWTGRVGLIFDQTPVPTTTLDFQLPDAPRFDLTAGFGATLSSQVQVDIGALWVLPTSSTTSDADALAPPVKGTFDVSAWVVTISVGMQFGVADSSLLLERFPPSSPEAASVTALPAAAPATSPLFEPTLPAAPSSAPSPPPAPSPGADSADPRCRRFPGVRALQHQARCPSEGLPFATPRPATPK